MKKTIATLALILAAGTAQAETAKVYHYDLDKKVTIDKSDILSEDLICVGRLSVFRDHLFNTGQAKSSAMKLATDSQDKLFMKYPFTIPTKWIDQEKKKFLKLASTLPEESVTKLLQNCL